MSTGAAGFPAVSTTVPRSTTELSRDGLTSRPWPINLARVSLRALRMRSLVVRRHSLRSPGGVHLSPEGVHQARRVGRFSGNFDRVVTSPKPRALAGGRGTGRFRSSRVGVGRGIEPCPGRRTPFDDLPRRPDRARGAGAVPDFAIRWGRTLAPLEGFRLDREGDRWIQGEIFRWDGGPRSADGGPDPRSHLGRGAGRVDGA